jgi:uroporphyrin-III C-methyltransferase
MRADVADISEQPEQEVKITPAEPEVKTVEKASKSSLGFLFPIIIIALIIGLAGAGYYFLMQLRSKQEGLGGEVKSQLMQQINDYQKQLTAIQTQVSNLQSAINGKDEHFSKTLTEFTELHGQKMDATRKELNDKMLQLQRQLGKTRGDWLVADAEYLLSVANERLHLIGDVNTTKAALEAADQRLRESGDSGTIKVREAIAKELASLQGLAQPDLVGLYASIQALQGDVAKLALALPYAGKPLASPEEARSENAKSAESNELLSTAIQELQGIVTIRHSESNVKEILTEEQAEFIREQLRVKLEMLKVALAHQYDDLYQATLKDVKDWLEKHFNKSDEAKLFDGELSRLQGVRLKNQLPDISQSLKLLRDLSKLRIETDKLMEEQEQSQTEEKPADANEKTVPATITPPPAENAVAPPKATPEQK